MPQASKEQRRPGKRMAAATDGQRSSRKEVKRAHETPHDSKDEAIAVLEKQILQSRKHYNNITVLLQQARGTDPAKSTASQNALCRVFCHLLASEALGSATESGGNDEIIQKWLSDRLEEVWALAPERLHEQPLEEQTRRVRLLMQLLKEESTSSRSQPLDFLKRRAVAICKPLGSDSTGALCDFYVNSFALEYLDLAYLLAYGVHHRLEEDSETPAIDVNIRVLTALTDAQPEAFWTSQPPADPADRKKKTTVTPKTLKKAIGEGWLAVLSKPLEKQQRKTLLRLIPKKIAPCLARSEKLLDFLVDSFDAGGSTALIALSGLFDLIQEKNLDYPHFYRKVYAMLDSSILHSKHRSSFLRLLDTFLSSTHLPAALVASFLKRLARLCLFAPPAAIAFIVPLTYNLLKKHPNCTFMIHRVTSTDESQQEKEQNDPFDMKEEDPMETGALESSLWELHTLESHYHPNVAIIARIISEQFTKPAYNVEDFLDHSYASMLESDLSKPLKKEPVVEYQIPKVVFPRQARDLPAVGDNVLELWSFDG